MSAAPFRFPFAAVRICIEGIDGVGKSTQTRALVATLQTAAVPCYQITEPSDGPVGSALRALIHKGEPDNLWTRRVRALAFAADRLDAWNREGVHAMQRGITVVSDRGILSSLAYQADSAREREEVLTLNKWAPRPDLVIFMRLSPEQAYDRIVRRGPVDAEETLARLEVLERRYDAAIEFVRQLPPRDRMDVREVSARGAPWEVASAIEKTVRLWGEEVSD
jgi:dTMP kinase